MAGADAFLLTLMAVRHPQGRVRLRLLCGVLVLLCASTAMHAQERASEDSVAARQAEALQETPTPGGSSEERGGEAQAAETSPADGRRVEDRAEGPVEVPVEGPVESGALGVQVDRLDDEISALRGLVNDQMLLLRGLVEDLAPLLDEIAEERIRASSADEEAECQREIAELNARLQQQQLAVDEAQRRAEKAEKLAAALDEAEARAAIEIERLSNALATAKARQAEALQQTVQLERRLADAEARLQPVAMGSSADRDPPERQAQESRAAGQSPRMPDAGKDAAAGDAAAGEAGTGPAEDMTDVVVYEVRASDTLSSISDRVYGDAGAWRRIYDANRDLLASPEALQPGMPLVIP